MIQAIMGLGNPGKEYEDTRHNLGFRVVDELAIRWGVRAYEQGRQSLYTQVMEEERAVLVVRPTTYMNRSGLAWLEMAGRFNIAAERTLVVCDDLNLPLGRIRIRAKGRDGGHNGLASILKAAGTECVPRLRLGLGEPVGYWEDFVLSPFEENEQLLVERVVFTAADAVETLLRHGIVCAMDQFNHLHIAAE